MAEQRPHCAPALHLVCRRFLIRINCLARLPVRQNLIQNLSAASCVSGSSSRFRPRVPLPVDVFCQGVHFTFYHPPLSHLSKHVGGTQPSWHFPPLSHQSNTQLPSSWTTPVVRDLYPGSSARKEEQIFFLSVILQSLGMLGINHSVVETMDNCPAKKPHKRNLSLIICMKS